MIKRVLGLLLVGAVLGGGGYAYQQWEIRGLDQIRILRRGTAPVPAPAAPASATPPAVTPVPRPTPTKLTIRVAAFNLGRFDESRLANPRTREIFQQVLGRFDLVALQEVRARNQGLVVRLVEQLNTTGRKYDYAVAPIVQSEAVEQYSAFLFDTAAIDVDRLAVDVVEQLGARLAGKPLVGLFRACGPAADEAFTFRLLSVAVDPSQVDAELALVATAYRAVRDRHSEEDDLILLGTFNAETPQMDQFQQSLGLSAVIDRVPTTTRGTGIADNLMFPRNATTEFTGRSGVVDLMREFNLTMQEALEVSDHLPVWAEFSVYEGGQPGQPR
jgi:deoxyribonuclease-1-like protein